MENKFLIEEKSLKKILVCSFLQLNHIESLNK